MLLGHYSMCFADVLIPNIRDFIQVSPHKNIKKTINRDVLAENVFRGYGKTGKKIQVG